ncbi:hypothetical protein [Methylobacterium sp. 13MFTsu3.1M2]|uniref:hypothetical protein n=1 Tax=Methylobacterium sp. 13MFTsu3.1M2 TaxID=1502776 RepID=UPI0008DEBD5C|nr:hypothetical protein [Methylobacterium sp. 13MFTsu3.1M2]SFD67575.1 hypothetical protein SAMN02799627_01257 [Methylobacterium sp. 13MFTsu3.1M2]
MGPRRKDPARFPVPRAGNRIGHRIARRAAALMAGLLAGLLLPAAAQAQIKVRKADCFFAADGRTVIDGVCEFLTDARSYGVGGFRLATYTNGYLRDGVVVSVTAPGQGTATWNREPGGKPEDGPADGVTAEGACWTGSRSRICAWKVGEGRPGFGGAPAAAPEAGAPRAADCYLEVAGDVRLDGACQFRSETGQTGARGFEIRSYAAGKLDVVAQLVRDPQNPLKATAFWNGSSGGLRAAEALGALSPSGPCWDNDGARLCVWQPGQPRGGWDRRAEARAPAPPETPPSPPPAQAPAQAPSQAPPPPRDGAEGRDPPPGTFLKLSFKGRCESLMMDGEDLTATCAPEAVNTSVVGSPKAGFIFGTTDGKAMAFMASTKGFVEGGTLHQPVDELMYAERDQSTFKVKGTCEMPNPMGGPVVITCNAQSANSTYAVRFRTDGGKPVLTRGDAK